MTNFINKIFQEPLKEKYRKSDLLKQEYFMGSNNNLKIYYAPFEYINKSASVVIIGITPGWTQMEKSFRTFIKAIKEGNDQETSLRLVKRESSFAGSMRTNLIKMLDELGLNKKLNIGSCHMLFNDHRELLHSTSVLKYPVFKNDNNYTGSSPSPIKNEFLWNFVEEYFLREINIFQNRLVIPLGKNVNNVLAKLTEEEKLKSNCILDGFPHPSGANAHRLDQFKNHKELLIQRIQSWEP